MKIKDALHSTWDCLLEGYWQTVSFIGRHPAITLMLIVALVMLALR
jgi:hypothetical protein